jgi:hypothetical protein
MTMINKWIEKVKKAYGKLFKKSLSPVKKQQRGKLMLKELLEKQVNSIIDANELTDMQVWGCWCGIGFVCALIVMWII